MTWTTTKVTRPKLAAFLADLAAEPYLVLSVTDRSSFAVNAHGRFYLHPREWPASARQAALAEDLLGMGIPNDPRTETGEPHVHVHVDWNQITRLRFETKPLNRIGADVKIVLAREVQVLAFYAKEAGLKRLVGEGYPRNRWIDL
jgi:hypothetical protein